MSNESTNTGPAAYTVPAAQMQAIVNTLAGLPWGQVNNVITPLLTLIKEQEAPPPAA